VPNFIAQALRGDPITVFGDGTQTRSFCYVNDTVEGIYRLLMSDETDPVNIGNPQEMTILQFAHRIIELTASSSRITFVQPKDVRIKDDPKVRQPDITKAQRVLGWEPKIGLEEGLGKTIEWFRERV
jgi:dTDP-glucose 4,6-dehydratase